MNLEVFTGGVIFAAIVVIFVMYRRSKKTDTSGDGTPGPGKDQPPRTDRPGPLDR